MCKVYTGYYATSEIQHGLSVCMVNNPLSKAHCLSLYTGGQTMLYLLHDDDDDYNDDTENRCLKIPLCILFDYLLLVRSSDECFDEKSYFNLVVPL